MSIEPVLQSPDLPDAPPESIEQAAKTIHGNARAIHETRLRHQPYIDSLEAEKARVEELLEDAKAKLAKDLEYPTARIYSAHHFLVQQGAAPKTFPTAFGVAKYSEPVKQYTTEIKDPAALVAWLKQQVAFDALWVQPAPPMMPPPRPDATKVRQTLSDWVVAGDKFISPDGEVVPGVTAVPTVPTQTFTPTENP